jgi:hypothetical protein
MRYGSRCEGDVRKALFRDRSLDLSCAELHSELDDDAGKTKVE